MMLTRCPGCATTFRVTPEQVKARHGKVRCGRCQHVFDAIEFLVDAALATPAATPATPSAEVTAPAPETLPDTNVVHEVPTVAVAAPAPEEPLPAETEVSLSPAQAATENDILLQPSPLSASYNTPQTHVRTLAWPWTIASLLVLSALIAQLMIAFRVDLAVKYPDSRPALEMLCEYALCSIELPSNPELVSIEVSDLHPGKKSGLELTATLHNRAPHAQAWPHLELTLTDGADKPIVRKVIAPAIYLPATQTEGDGFPANGEQAVQLLFDTGNLPAAGYRLYLFYP